MLYFGATIAAVFLHSILGQIRQVWTAERDQIDRPCGNLIYENIEIASDLPSFYRETGNRAGPRSSLSPEKCEIICSSKSALAFAFKPLAGNVEECVCFSNTQITSIKLNANKNAVSGFIFSLDYAFKDYVPLRYVDLSNNKKAYARSLQDHVYFCADHCFEKFADMKVEKSAPDNAPFFVHNSRTFECLCMQGIQGQAKYDYYAISGIFHSTKPLRVPCTHHVGYEFLGKKENEYDSNNVKECCDYCEKEPRCHAYSYSSSLRKCYTLDNAADSKKNPDFTSGFPAVKPNFKSSRNENHRCPVECAVKYNNVEKGATRMLLVSAGQYMTVTDRGVIVEPDKNEDKTQRFKLKFLNDCVLQIKPADDASLALVSADGAGPDGEYGVRVVKSDKSNVQSSLFKMMPSEYPNAGAWIYVHVESGKCLGVYALSPEGGHCVSDEVASGEKIALVDCNLKCNNGLNTQFELDFES